MVPARLSSTIDATTETFIDGTSIKTITQYATTETISYSPFVENSGGSSTSNIYIISAINSNAEAYFGGYNISGAGDLTIGPITGYSTEFADTVTLTDPGDATTVKYPATTRALGPNSEIWIRSDGETFAYSATPNTGQIITFPTPFVYFPTRGGTGGSGEVANVACDQTGGNENYGYVPQTIIDHMASDPAISSQYPRIASCLQGGPSILHLFYCAAPAPTSQSTSGQGKTNTMRNKKL
jgi:hypothetical protein